MCTRYLSRHLMIPIEVSHPGRRSDWDEPRRQEVEQVASYAEDLRHRYPELALRRHVVYTIGAATYRFFALDR